MFGYCYKIFSIFFIGTFNYFVTTMVFWYDKHCVSCFNYLFLQNKFKKTFFLLNLIMNLQVLSWKVSFFRCWMNLCVDILGFLYCVVHYLYDSESKAMKDLMFLIITYLANKMCIFLFIFFYFQNTINSLPIYTQL